MVGAFTFGYRRAAFGVDFKVDDTYYFYNAAISAERMFQRRMEFATYYMIFWTAVAAGLTVIGCVTVYAISQSRRER